MPRTKTKPRNSGASTREQITDVLLAAKAPLTIHEVSVAIYGDDKPEYADQWIRTNVYRLMNEGTVSRRVETQAERIIRANGRDPRGYQAMLYWIGNTVPARVVVEAVDGYILDDSGNYGAPSTGRRRQIEPELLKIEARPGIQAQPLTDSKPGLVEAFIALTDEILSLKARVAALETINSRLADALKF